MELLLPLHILDSQVKMNLFRRIHKTKSLASANSVKPISYHWPFYMPPENITKLLVFWSFNPTVIFLWFKQTPTLFTISTVKSCQGYYYRGYFCTIHVRKQTSFFLWKTVQRLYRPLPGPWDNFLFETGAPRKGSFPGIEWSEPVIEQSLSAP